MESDRIPDVFTVEAECLYNLNVRGRLQKTSGKWGGGGFEISDGGGWFVKIRTSENCWKKFKIPIFPELIS